MCQGLTSETCVATANVLGSLSRSDARDALAAVMGHRPDLVGLQEWGPSRGRLLAEHVDYVWAAPAYGGCPVGARADRFDFLHTRARVLGLIGRADRGVRAVPLLPPRTATLAVFRDRWTGGRVSLVCFHLVPAVQQAGRYREDRPLLVTRHRREVQRLAHLVAAELAADNVTYAVGDSNYDGLVLPGVTSAWVGRADGPGTLGSRRKVDDVFGPGPATSVTLVATASDHRAVIARRGTPSAS